jgi:hypothetical protein
LEKDVVQAALVVLDESEDSAGESRNPNMLGLERVRAIRKILIPA